MRRRSLLNFTNLKKQKFPPYFKDFQLATQSLWKPLLQEYICREPGNVPYMSSCPSFTGLNEKVKLQFMDGLTIYSCSSGFHNDWVAS
jgi:hypothetical protein